MPLTRGSSREVIGHNVAVERRAGKPRDQAVAIALSEARRTDTRSTVAGGEFGRKRRRPEHCHEPMAKGRTCGLVKGHAGAHRSWWALRKR